MRRVFVKPGLALLLAAAALVSACSAGDAKTKDAAAAERPPVSVSAVAATEQPIARFIRATGTLMAEEQADVAAETAGRVTSATIERGTAVSQGAELVRLSSTETDAQLKEAEANAAQIEARLGITSGGAFDVNAVPEVQNAKATAELTQSEFTRIKSLLDQRVVSQSEYDQRRTQAEAARQQYEAAKNGGAASRSARADDRGARAERQRRPEAGPVRDRAHRAAGEDAGRARSGRGCADERRHQPRVRHQRRSCGRADRHDRRNGRRSRRN